MLMRLAPRRVSFMYQQTALPIQDKVDNLLADGVVTPGVVVRGILLPGHQLLRVEQLTVRPGTNLQTET